MGDNDSTPFVVGLLSVVIVRLLTVLRMLKV